MDAPTQSTVDASSVYSTYSLAEQAIRGIYVPFSENNSYRNRFLQYYGVCSDIETTTGTQAVLSSKDVSKVSLTNYNTQSNNTEFNTDNNVFTWSYQAIERANLVIDGIRTYGDISSNEDLRHLLGEALTMRAFYYSELIKTFGDVPARFSPNSNDNIYLPRTSKDSIYKVILNDLAEAENYCYWPNESEMTQTTERVSKTFVKGLRARIALAAGGYKLYADGYGLSNDADLAPLKMYAIAAQECEEIIEAGYNKLATNFEDIFNQNGISGDVITAGGESIFEIGFATGRGRIAYAWAPKHNSKDQYTDYSAGSTNGPMPTLFYDYDVDDARRDVTCVPYTWSKSSNAVQELNALNKWSFGKLRYEWMNRKATSSDDGLNWVVMRMSDIYLMAAEAENELGNTDKAWTYMKPVLDRVLPAAKVSALKDKYTDSQTSFREGIYDQRAFEFAGETLRKQDLVRWGIIDTKMAEQRQKLTDLANRTGDYADLPEKLYYTYEADGETLKIYGLNHGDTDDEGKVLKDDEGYQTKSWFVSNSINVITDDYINGFYVNTPSLNYLWPIFDVVINANNGMLNNDGNYGQLSK